MRRPEGRRDKPWASSSRWALNSMARSAVEAISAADRVIIIAGGAKCGHVSLSGAATTSDQNRSESPELRNRSRECRGILERLAGAPGARLDDQRKRRH